MASQDGRARGSVKRSGRTKDNGARRGDGTGGGGQGGGNTSLAAVHRLHGAAIHLLRSLRAADARSGLSGPKLSVLSVLVFGGPASPSALAEAEQVRRPTMTQLINTLEAEGLVRKRPAGNDRRQVRVEATARGRELLEAGRSRRLAELAARFEALTPADQAALIRALDALERLARRPEKQ